MNIFGQNIAYLRRKSGLTQQELGLKCFFSKYGIGGIERELSFGSTARHLMLAEYFNQDLEYLNSFLLEDIDKLKELAPNPICDKIEQILIDYGHCIETKNKFTG